MGVVTAPPEPVREGLSLSTGSGAVRVGHVYASVLASSRRNSEDRLDVIEHGDDVVVVVADGAGGMCGGAAASDALVSAVTSCLRNPGLDVHGNSVWESVLASVDQKLACTMAGETTAVIAVVGPRGIVGTSTGDSEAWVVSETGFDDLTAGQCKKRLGSGRAAPVSFFRPRFEGTLVVGTDGLFGYAKMEAIVEVVRRHQPAGAVEGLRALVRLRSGAYPDDLGVVVLT